MDPSLIYFIIAIIALIWLLMRFSVRRKQHETPKLQAAMNVIGSLNDNLRILETHINNRTSTKKFRTGELIAWHGKLDFLDKNTQDAIKETTSLTTEFNNQIDVAKKAKTAAVLQDLPVEKLKEPLAKSKEGLVTWLRANLETEMRHNTRKNFFGF